VTRFNGRTSPWRRTSSATRWATSTREATARNTIPGHPFFNDLQSIMNVGRTVRPRHLRLILETLAKMVPGCRFTATVI